MPGIIPLIVPEAVLESVPILSGEAKLPVELLSCNVNVLPTEKTPDVAYEILTPAPAQVSVKPIDDISMVDDEPPTVILYVSVMHWY